MATLTLTFLGSFQAAIDNQPIARFRSDKARALLAYLAVEAERPHSRASLCGLLWPDQNDDAALHNLSQTLLRLREALGDTRSAAAFLRISRPAIQWNAASTYRLDTSDFAHLASSTDPDDLDRAVALYRGEFLPGFSLAGCAGFEEWLLLSRERFAHLALTALDTLTHARLAGGRYVEAAQHARRQLTLEPWREEAHRQLMRALAASGDRAAALAAYSRCRQVLHDDLGVAPDEATRALYDQIRTNELKIENAELKTAPILGERFSIVNSQFSSSQHNLPTALTPLIGRETELSELSELLRAPETRLLTIVGAGGMGKTRLGLELARASLALFADGAYFVALAPLASADALASAIVRALDLTVQSGELTAELLRALRDKQLLLLLDNFEHLLDATGLVVELLRAVPGLRIVATSRERLNVLGEQRYVVQGMAYQPDGTDADPADLAAVRLFAQSAQRVRPQFSLSEEDLPSMLQICRLTLGMPLGLELAAAWVEMLPLAEIAAQIERSADFLAADMRDLPERQRSIRAVFDWSWRLLRADEQRILRQLTVFRGEFTIAAAQAVAEASLPSLHRLVEKSLLRINDGRYELHDLLRQFAAEQLDDGERAAVRRRHASYYLALAEETATVLAGPEQAAAMARLSREHDNLRAALAWCLEELKIENAELRKSAHQTERQFSISSHEIGLRLAGALWPFWEHYCHLSEGRRWLESFLGDERARTVAPEVRAMALIGAGCLAQDQDDNARANALFEEGLRLERTLGRSDRVTRVLAHRGIMVRAQGQYAQATTLLEESLALARVAGDRAGIAYVLRRLGGVMRERGDYARAASHYQECLATCRALGDRSGEGSVLLGLGDIARDQGDAATAEAYSAESLVISRELGQNWIAGFALNNLAQAAIMRGDYAQALPLADEALALFRAQDIHGGVVELLITQGQIACAQGKHERARAVLVEGVAQGWQVGPHELVAAGMEELARVAVARQNAAHAVRLCAAASAWREAMDAPQQPYRRPTYEATLAAARQMLGEAGFAAAWAEGAAWRREQAVAAAQAEGQDTALEQPIQRSVERPQPATEERLSVKEIGRPDDTQPNQRVSLSPLLPASRSPDRGWGEIPQVGPLYGRQAETAEVERWLLHDSCRLIALLGMGGVGKTALAASVVQAIAAHFDTVIWHSLLNAPPLDEILRAALQVLSGYSLAELPATLDEQLELMLEYLRRSRCLLVLDNLESILQPGQAGAYQDGYAPYGQLIQRLAESRHSSCLLLTSRERPQNLARLSENLPTVQMLRLSGLEPAAGQAMLAARGLPIQDADAASLVQRYSGNPLALKLVAQTVQELFGGQIRDFLAVEAPIFGDIGAVLDQQYARLSALEQEVLLWLAVGREPMTIMELRADLLQPGSPREFVEALRGLQRRGLLEQAAGAAFALQNVILEYLTERLVDEACDAIEGAHVERFNRHALLKAQAKEYVRQTQARRILQPLVERLAGRIGRAGVEARLRRLLASLRERTPRLPGYAGGNVLNLLLHLGVDLHGYDFSQLSVWQADLRGVATAAINFSHADLSHSAFTAVFDLAALHFTAAGQLLVAGLVEGELCLWRAADGGLHDLFRRPGAGGHPVVFSRDGQLVANCGFDHSVRVWSTATGERLHTLQGHTDVLYTLAFSADGRRLASSSRDGTVRVWDVQSGQLLHSLHEHAAGISALAFSTDGTMLAGGGDRVICLWHTLSGQVIRTLLGHRREIECFAFTADDRQLVSGSHDGSIRLWDVASGQSLRTLEGHSQIVRAVVLHPDGHTLASGGADRVVRLWDLRDGQTLQPPFDNGYEVVSLAFSANGQVLASGSVDRTVKLWDTFSGNLLDTLRGHVESVRSVHFSPNGELLASSSATGIVRLWDVGALEAAAHGQLVRSLRGHARELRSVVFSPDGRLLASGGVDQVVQVWDVESGTARHTFRGHTNTIKTLAFRPDGQVLASGGSDRTIRLWPISAASTPTEQTGRVVGGHADEISSLAFSPDGRTLLSSSLDHTARVWAIDGGQERQVLTGQGCALSGAVFSPDGQLVVATSYDGTVNVWDAGSGQRLELWSGSDITSMQLAFSPDGATLAYTTSDQVIVIRHAATGAVLQTLRGHKEPILSIAFSPTRPILASSGWDGMIRVWDAETGACLHTLRAPGPYAGMNIAGVTGISETQKAALWALGAVEEAPLTATPQIEQPAPHSVPSPPHNLPSPLTSFVGRADELASLAALLAGDTRLVTLIGAGGAGKTRLALALAWQLLAQFADGVWWVALAGVQPVGESAHQRATLASAVATALRRTLAGRRYPLDELADALQDRAALLVLDNCEHLPEVAAVARGLIEAAPQVRVVATSREPLGLGGEALVRLEGLPVPLPGAADPASYPGVQLFLERAAQHAPDWGQGSGTIAATARLCRLLEGLPLGIELAAHWVGHYTPDDIAEAIQADLDFLAVRARDIPDRHRSLRAVFDYAWHLLSAAEQRALSRLSVFRGSFDGTAAQAVAEVGATTLVALVDKSLLRQAGAEHYSLHEMLRQFAAERLLASGEVAAMRAQHAAYYRALAELAMPELAGPRQATWLERLDRALDNLRAALSWAHERGQTELGLRLAGALERFWFTRGYLGEGREWLERFLRRTSALEVPPAVRAQAFSAAGLLANTQGDRSQATRWLEQGLACYREADDLAGAAGALTTLGGVAYDQGDLHGAIERWDQSLAQARAMGDPGEVARALGNLGEAHYHLGKLARAEALHTEALALARQAGRANLEAYQLGDLGNVARRQGDLVRATALHRQALELKRALGARRQIAITLEDLAAVAAAAGHGTRAACLLGAANTIREAIGTPQAIPERIATEQAVAGARSALGEESWAAAFMAGLALSLDQAITYALE